MSLLKTGSTGAGSLTQLIATGALNNYLTANASFTFWRVKYNKHTQFSMESIYQDFNSVVQFGREANLTLNRNGDLVYFCYVAIQLDGLTTTDTNGTTSNAFPLVSADPASTDTDCETGGDMKDETTESGYAHYVNGIGQFIVEEAKFHIGGSEVDKLYSDYLFCWEELSGRSGRRLIEMIGKRYSRDDLICDSKRRRVLYVPLPWYFTMHSGQALSLASLQFHSIQMSVTFAPLSKCIVTDTVEQIVKSTSTNNTITSSDLMAGLETTYIFLDVQERDKFSTSSYEVLVTQVQRYSWEMKAATPNLTLPFNHPVIELIWFIRRKKFMEVNNHFNFSGFQGSDPMRSATLLLNNQTRFSDKPGHYFRTVVPYEKHSNIPDAFIYNYSFALHPEDPSPSGSCNFSRIDTVSLRLELNKGKDSDSVPSDKQLGDDEPVEVVVFARSWNVLRFKEGLAGIGFAN